MDNLYHVNLSEKEALTTKMCLLLERARLLERSAFAYKGNFEDYISTISVIDCAIEKIEQGIKT